MGCKELIESLRRAADERIKKIWEDADAEADRIRAEDSNKLEQLRANCSRMESMAVTTAQIAAVSEANNRSRTNLLTAEKALSDRLFSLALSSLHLLRNSRYRETFGKMAREIPPLPWKTVRVNPEDVDIARSIFKGADVIPDGTITGGVDAMTDEGKIRITNTFEKRLERAWVDILPELLKKIYDAVEKRA